jgi:hypothetical protein
MTAFDDDDQSDFFNYHEHMNHLEPLNDLKTEYYGGYGSRLPSFHNGFSDKPFARFTSSPAFSKQYAFSVERKDDVYSIISNSYWVLRVKDPSTPKIVTTSVEIDKELYEAIGELFQLLADQTKKPEGLSVGNDGTTYYFAITDKTGAIKVGSVWSPSSKSLLSRVVKICHTLYAVSKGEGVLAKDLQIEIKRLMEDLKK